MTRPPRERAPRSGIQRPAAQRPGNPAGGPLAQRLQQAMALHRAGQLREAEAAYRRVLAVAPDQPDALHLLGLLAFQAGQAATALELAERAVAADRRVARYHNTRGLALAALDRARDAAEAFRAALELDPRHADALLNLGNLQRRHGDPAGAAGLYRRALALKPQSVEALTGLGGALCETGRFAEALPHLAEAQKLRPDDPGPLTLLGNALAALRRPAAAECFEQALRLRPDFAPALAALGDWYRRGSRPERAVEYLERAAAAEPANPHRQAALGDALIAAARYDEAEACLRPLAVVEPGFVPGHVLLARLLRVLGRFDDSLDSLTRALAAAPDDPEVLIALVEHYGAEHYGAEHHGAEHHGADLPDGLLDRLRAAADRADRAGGRGAAARFALAQALAARGDHRAAFAEFVRANETRRAALARAGRIYDPARQERDIDRLIAVFTPELFAEARAATGFRSELPVFVTGMPRSGTTLVEQILASHSAVHAAGELRLVADITALLPGQPDRLAAGGEAPLYPECLVPLNPDRLRRLAEDHVDRLAALAQAAGRPGARRVVDKQPLNFLHLGLVALLWPQARIIHCRRDPRDTLLSCYTQSFETQYAWCWDQDSLAHFHRQHDRLMTHWRRVLPLPLLEIEYEALVADAAGEARRLIESTGLAWEDACADFHRTDRPVATASVFQVRRPIYASAVGKWRRYETELQPLLKALGDAAQDRKL